ncbi:hypothetical protein ACFQ2Y_16505 [Streptomyces malaysiensis subsp. malaysiensis]
MGAESAGLLEVPGVAKMLRTSTAYAASACPDWRRPLMRKNRAASSASMSLMSWSKLVSRSASGRFS